MFGCKYCYVHGFSQLTRCKNKPQIFSPRGQLREIEKNTEPMCAAPAVCSSDLYPCLVCRTLQVRRNDSVFLGVSRDWLVTEAGKSKCKVLHLWLNDFLKVTRVPSMNNSLSRQRTTHNSFQNTSLEPPGTLTWLLPWFYLPIQGQVSQIYQPLEQYIFSFPSIHLVQSKALHGAITFFEYIILTVLKYA